MPTRVASEGTKASAAQSSSRRAETGQVFLTNIIHDVAVENGHSVPLGNLLPTTQAQNGEDRNNKIWARDPSKPQNLENALAVTLLPTTRTSMANGPTQKEIKAGNPKTRIETEVMLGETSWGKFEPAIRRWEQTLGRPSPLPTKPDGKDGAHRLSSAFTEWMMGLPEGWVTGVGLTRNEELKACGNGVVPQQAELALRILLEGVTLPQALHMVSDRIEASQGNVIPDPQTDNETIGSISLPAEEAGNNANN